MIEFLEEQKDNYSKKTAIKKYTLGTKIYVYLYINIITILSKSIYPSISNIAISNLMQIVITGVVCMSIWNFKVHGTKILYYFNVK